MRRLALLFAFVAAACSDPPEPETPRPPAPPPIQGPNVKWKSVEGTRKLGWDIEISVPEAWTDGHKVVDGGRQIHFRGPVADAGWNPELQFGWTGSDTPLDALVRKRIGDLEALPSGRVETRGTATVAGMPASWFVYAFQRNAGGTPQEMREISFYFGRGGFLGFVRGVCSARMFEECLPIYREAAARVRYSPQ
jgi:hypothetical protein